MGEDVPPTQRQRRLAVIGGDEQGIWKDHGEGFVFSGQLWRQGEVRVDVGFHACWFCCSNAFSGLLRRSSLIAPVCLRLKHL